MTKIQAHPNEYSGCPVITVSHDGEIVHTESSYQYQVPVVLDYNGEKYVAFSEYYLGIFKAYTVYKMTEVE